MRACQAAIQPAVPRAEANMKMNAAEACPAAKPTVTNAIRSNTVTLIIDRVGYDSAENESGRKKARASAEYAPPSSAAPSEMIAIRLALQPTKNGSRQRSEAMIRGTGISCMSRVATREKIEIATSTPRFGRSQVSA